MSDKDTQYFVTLELHDKVYRAAMDFVEDREEATSNIWYCNGDKGRELLKALGVPYVEKS